MADEEKQDDKMSRRRFIRNSGYVAGGAIGGGILGTFIGTNFLDDTENRSQENNSTNYNRALKFFTRRSDFQILSAASERIYPKDELGPGAIELGAPYFIDHELAGSYGNNEREYIKGPFFEGTEYQGFQTPLKRNAIFMAGIRELENQSKSKHDKFFVDLEGEQQDEILKKFENDEVKLKHVSSAYFFDLLRSATLSGTYADPLYGGNADMQGWKMKDFPGSQMSYINRIGSEEFIEVEPKSLGDHQS
ncbi:gluconate 2-dehydrogenase subunit 3 family protein [Lentibacillus jeotgali]|uniref:gluconate 2-dehydrogenase subunit 3 family protein n=1 Tax=Lentibacillus jeotgali TaxID=558169 RepID=UPI0002626042|nr:gluconate 2-dehydrogenase subunit 3 family protein [Lentibacillus jeotgali]